MYDDVLKCTDAIERGYEFLLAFAAQGIDADSASKSGGEMREHLRKMDAALDELPEAFAGVIAAADCQPADRYEAFLEVLRHDAGVARTAVQLVMCQAAISSQLVDNLNATVHLRTLLTDIFLLDEVVKRAKATAPVTDPGS